MWLGPSVDLLTKRGYRQALSRIWEQISDVDKLEFHPNEPWQFHLWRSEEGSTINEAFKAPQSWMELRLELKEMETEQKGTMFWEQPIDWLLFLTVFPHRVSRKLIRAIDGGIHELLGSHVK